MKEYKNGDPLLLCSPRTTQSAVVEVTKTWSAEHPSLRRIWVKRELREVE